MSYHRIIPRDLFNEAKLLKCMGKISLLIHEKMIPGLNIDHENSELGFKINQSPLTGSLYIENLYLYDDSGEPVMCSTPLNSREKWPLVLDYQGGEYWPFNEKGDYQLDKNKFVQK